MKCLEATGDDRDEWLAAWQMTGREPFAHPDYVNLFSTPKEAAVALVSNTFGATVLLPLIRRSLPDQAQFESHNFEPPWMDAVSPYGYGGPFTSGAEVAWHDYYVDLLAWMRASRVLTCFVRMSLDAQVLRNPSIDGFTAKAISDNVVVDTTRPMAEQWQHYAHKVRKNVNKARREGLRVGISRCLSDIPSFLAVYYETMERRQADARYYFDERFFESLEGGGASLLQADVFDREGRVVSTEIVLESDASLYSFLGGTLADSFVHAPNDLLKHEVIAYASAHGKKRFVLGGGYEHNDGIFRYKRGFDVDGVVTFFGLQLIADETVYDSVSPKHGVANRATEAESSYFPRYRQPSSPDVSR